MNEISLFFYLKTIFVLYDLILKVKNLIRFRYLCAVSNLYQSEIVHLIFLSITLNFRINSLPYSSTKVKPKFCIRDDENCKSEIESISEQFLLR